MTGSPLRISAAAGKLRILAVAGSLRRASWNRRLLDAVAAVAERAGAEIDRVEARDLVLPLYDGDLEAESGLPPGAEALKARISAADGLLMACPEYNHSIPGVFKNAIDWASRPPGKVFADKPAALLGASPSESGALRALVHLRQVLTSRGSWVVPAQVSLPHAREAFDGNGALRDEAVRAQVDLVVGQLLDQARRLRGE